MRDRRGKKKKREEGNRLMVLKRLPRGSLQQPQFGRDGAGRVEMSDGRAGRRSLKRPEKCGLFKTRYLLSPLPNRLVSSGAIRQAPSFAGVSSVPKWAVPFLRLGAERTRAGCSGPGWYSVQAVNLLPVFHFTSSQQKGGEPKRGAALLKFTTGGFTIVHTV